MKNDHHIVSFPPVDRAARKAAFEARRAERGSVRVKIPTGKLGLTMSPIIIMKGPEDPNTRESITRIPSVGSLAFIGAAPSPVESGNREDILADMVGYADHYGVTGGGGAGGSLVTVTNLNNSGPGSLRQAVADASGATWIRFDKDLGGTIFLSTRINLKSDMTIDGRGANVLIDGTGDSFALVARGGPRNIIFMYIKVQHPAGTDSDAVSFLNNTSQSSANANTLTELIWLYHCDFLDSSDGSLDFSRTRARATIQSCYFRNASGTGGSGKCHLVTNGTTGLDWDDIDQEITATRNHWDNIQQRYPRLGAPCNYHQFNDYIENPTFQYQLSSNDPPGNPAQLFLEKSIVDGLTGDLFDVTLSGFTTGWTKSSGNLLTGPTNAVLNNSASVFTPPYSYTAQTADAALQTAIIAEAGWKSVPFPGD